MTCEGLIAPYNADMLIPLGTDVQRRRPTVITYWLIGANILVAIAMEILSGVDPALAQKVLDRTVLHAGADQFAIWQFFTSAFLHAGLMHLGGNMLFLWVFGSAVEERLGRIPFLLLYLAGAVISGLAQIAATEYHPGFGYGASLGASGAVAAITGSFLVFFPRTSMRVLLFFFLIGIFTIPAWWFIAFAITYDFLLQSLFVDSGVAHAAHLGGYACGIFTSFVLLAFRVIDRQPYDLFSMFRQARRRREFRELTAKQGRDPWMGRVGERDRSRLSRSTPASEAYAERRAEVSATLASGEADKAAAAYIQLLEAYPDAVMSRDAQLQIANVLMASGQHQHAASAYEGFLRRYTTDAESDGIRLLLALINARYLNDPVRAGELLSTIREHRLDDESRATLAELRKELA